VPWQTGDIVVCFGTSSGFGGACNVLRIVNGTAVLLDQFTDNLGGSTFGVAINNTLHVVATDDAGGSKVVVDSVASVNPNTSPASPIAHAPVFTYDTSANTGSVVKAVAINNAGNIFVLNSTSTTGNPNIVEIGPGPGQTAVATFSLSGCKDSAGNPLNQATSMDLSSAADANGNSLYAYVTSGGTIQKVQFSDSSCTKFADFGSNVTLYGIKDIPPGALANVSPNCNGATCPTDEALLVVAIGDTDPDAAETGESSPDPDAINVCTNQPLTSSSKVSCALLVDTDPTRATLTAPLWKAQTAYPGVGNVNTILDPQLKLQSVFTAGTSGIQEPIFDEAGGTVIDNAVKWTDITQPTWLANNTYSQGALPGPTVAAVANTFFVDPNGNLQTVTTAGTSGQIEPTSPFNPTTNPISWSTTSGGTTTDGLQWQFSGACSVSCPSLWVQGTSYPAGSSILDNAGFQWNAFTGGTSGAMVNRPLFEFHDVPNTVLPDNAVVWTESQPSRATSTAYVLNAIVLNTPSVPGAHVEQVSLAGTTGPGPMATPFSTSGGTVIDGLQWKNQTSPALAVVARYPVNGTTTLQSLALDPLIVDCTSGCTYPLPALKTSNFWLGDSQSANFYTLDFATGTSSSFSANGPIDTHGTACPTCATITGIQGFGIYGSEGANQAGLAKLLFNNSNTAPNNETAFFPSSTADPNTTLNKLTVTLYNGSAVAPALGPFAVYASAVAPGSCFSDLPGNPPCLPTFQPGATALPIMWKDDIPLPSSGNLTLSSTQTFSGNFDFPTNFQSLNNSVALDSVFDATTVQGLDLPGFQKPSTVHGYRRNQDLVQARYGCMFTSPVISPIHSCFANPGTFTIPIKFTCSGLVGTLGNYGVTSTTPWGPNFQVAEFGKPGSPPKPIPNPLPAPNCSGVASTGSAPNLTNAGNNAANLAPAACAVTQLPPSNGATTATFRSNTWAYNWQVQATSQGVIYEICAYDDSDGSWTGSNGHPGQAVCSNPFYVKTSCP
jgi:hypothetical protein